MDQYFFLSLQIMNLNFSIHVNVTSWKWWPLGDNQIITNWYQIDQTAFNYQAIGLDGFYEQDVADRATQHTYWEYNIHLASNLRGGDNEHTDE